MQVQVQILRVPLFGSARTETKTIDLDPPHISVMEAIEKAGFSLRGMQVTINGEPVDNLGLNAPDGAILRLAPAQKKEKVQVVTKHHHHYDDAPSSRVTLTERASGS